MKRQILISLLILLFAAGFATAATLNVDNLSGPYFTIQSAIDAANVGDVVIVASTFLRYYETIDFTNAEACTVTSANSLDPSIVADTIIDGSGLGGPVVTFGPIDDPNFFLPRDDPNFKEFVLAGFTITGGVAAYGGGIFCDADSVPTIKNCHIVDNNAVDMGMYEGDGGGVYLTGSSARFIGCWIANNSAEWYGGGIYCEGQAALSEDLPEFFNCLITNNKAEDYGGAMYCYDSSPVITLSTIVNNSGYYDPDVHGDVGSDVNGFGGIYCVDSEPTITNCIIWGNGDDLYECSATYSCIEDGDDGEGNIDEDPLFVRGPFAEILQVPFSYFGDYYLSQQAGMQLLDSPCVDAGTGTIRDYLADYIQPYSLGQITTCTESTPDASLVDMGYHYDYYYWPPIMYELRIIVIGNGTTVPAPDPNTHSYPMYTQVQVTAIPDPGHRVKSWNFNPTNFAPTYTVIMDDNKTVTVEFELIYHSTLHVGAGCEYTVIQEAIDDTRDGDVVVIHSGTYPSQAGCIVLGKNITIKSTNPYDPNIVAATVVDCNGEISGGFYIFGAGVGSCVLNGITIINSHTVVLTPDHGEDRPAGSRGFDGGAHLGGGALSVFGNHTVANCVVRNCSVEGADADYGWDGDDDVPGGDGGDGGDAAGAGIYIGSGSPTIKNCTVDNCIATGGDGGAGANGGDPTSGGDGGVPGRAMGGGVYYAAGTSPTFIDCTITNCQAVGGLGGDGGDATGDGGAGGFGGLTYYDPGQGDPANYSAYGAGVYCGTFITKDITFTGCTFSNNVSDGSVSGQGGLSWNGVQNQPRQNFNIPSFGAGAYCDIGSDTTFTNCIVQANVTTYYDDQYTGYGGGMCFEFASYAELNNCNIIDNNAPVGGGVYSSAVADLHIDDCNFVDNSAYIGGGIVSIESVGNISGCTFSGNSADDPNESIYGAGGGLFCFTSEALVSDCLISNNTASGSGGGVYFGGDPETITPFYGAPTLKNCLVLNNTAGRDGGGISCDWYSEPNIINCTINGNEARGDPPFYVGYGSGVFIGYESDVTIINSILWGNAGPNTIGGGEIAVGSDIEIIIDPVLTISYSDIHLDLEHIFLGPGATINWGEGNIDEDPLFVTGYYLSQIAAGQAADSPCVDAGKGSPADWGLQNYTTRTDSIPDAGVVLVEYLFDTDFSDTSGNAYHGIAVGNPVVSGGVLTLDGTSFVDLPVSFGEVNPFDGSCNFTIQMDFQINTPNPGTVGDCAGGILISSARDDTPDNHSMSVYVHDWLDPYWSEVVYDNFWVGAVGNEDNPADGAWHNINVAYSAVTQQTTIWLDGSNASAWGEPFNPAIPNIALDTVRLGGSLNAEFPYEEAGNLIGSIDNVHIIFDIVDMGYHYPLIIIPASCDFNADGYVDLADLAILLSYWLEQDCDLLDWCEGADLDFDTDVDFVDYAIFAQAYAPFLDVTPPEHDPSTWEVEPYEISPFTISMTATIATDESGPVEYLFERVSVGGQPNDVNSGWLTEREWEDTVFADETEYCYTVKARDKYLNETVASVEWCVWVDHTPPQPSTSTWFDPPHAISSTEIEMTAATAYDPGGGVEYYFKETTGKPGGSDRDWQGSPEYLDIGLNASTEYCYRVRTRDASGNIGDWSIEWCATTMAP